MSTTTKATTDKKKHKTPADYEALAVARGFVWLGPEAPNTTTKTTWQCQQRHRWEASYRNLRQGKGCPFCLGVARKTPADYKALAAARGFIWLGPEAPNTYTKTGWQCGQKHRWQATYSQIKIGSNCPRCAREAQFGRSRMPKTSADYHALAAERGFTWLGPEAANVTHKTRWTCGAGHTWWACYANIQTGRGCPYCARVARKTPKDYEALAGKRGIVWLGPEAPNAHTTTTWQCSQGHRWEADYSHISGGHGCPYCTGVIPIPPADYHALASQRGFTWLGPEVANVASKTWWQCGQGHTWPAAYSHIRRGRGCPYCGGNSSKTPTDYHNLARERGFVWLGPETSTTRVKTTWQCGRGHQWQATYTRIWSGAGCPYCAGRIRKAPADYEALARQRGFVWLGPEAPNAKTTTTWQCQYGHQWQTTYSHIRQGTGCPYCAGGAPKTPTDYEALAEARGFVWLGPETSTTMLKTTWQCSRGHRWQAHYHSIRNGSGCPDCARLNRLAKSSDLRLLVS